MGQAHFQEAIELFKQANIEYAKRQFGGNQWYPAFDGLATAYLEQENYEPAVVNVERSLALQPDYDSAMFHRAQIPDFEFRKTMAAGANNCSALKKFDEARALYARLLEFHPDVAVGYLNQGIMMLNKATRLRFDGSVGCDIEDTEIAGAGGASVALEKIENETEEQFRKTISLDPKNGDAWMQWGILLRQRQLPLPSERGGALEDHLRRPLLASAIENLQRALQLKGADPFIEGLLKTAQNELLALR
jgi:tetratricopeptide (TPR) repeat protein